MAEDCPDGGFELEVSGGVVIVESAGVSGVVTVNAVGTVGVF